MVRTAGSVRPVPLNIERERWGSRQCPRRHLNLLQQMITITLNLNRKQKKKQKARVLLFILTYVFTI